jgi:hypothetical protein
MRLLGTTLQSPDSTLKRQEYNKDTFCLSARYAIIKRCVITMQVGISQYLSNTVYASDTTGHPKIPILNLVAKNDSFCQ